MQILSEFTAWLNQLEKVVVFYYYHPETPFCILDPKDISHCKQSGNGINNEPIVKLVSMQDVPSIFSTYRKRENLFIVYRISFVEFVEYVLVPSEDMKHHLLKFGGKYFGQKISPHTFMHILNGDHIVWEKEITNEMRLRDAKLLFYFHSRAYDNMAYAMLERGDNFGIATSSDSLALKWQKRKRQSEVFERKMWQRLMKVIGNATYRAHPPKGVKMDTDEKKAEDTLKTNKKFFCEKHGHQIVAVIWKNAFVLECGCAYRFDDVRGVRLINSTDRPMGPTNV